MKQQRRRQSYKGDPINSKHRNIKFIEFQVGTVWSVQSCRTDDVWGACLGYRKGQSLKFRFLIQAVFLQKVTCANKISKSDMMGSPSALSYFPNTVS